MSKPVFKDNFSVQSGIYAKYRPQYPAELYSFLSSRTDEHDTAWDCGTGNGQAATGLAEFYKQVIATDPSEQQVKNSIAHNRVEYRVEKAEQTSVASNAIDLVTVANALHWFDFDAFYREAQRVLKQNGVLAAWAYGTPSVSPEIDAVIMHYHDVTVNEFWQPENRLVGKKYSTIPFPLSEIVCPAFVTQKHMNLLDLIGYLNTWSATQRFIAKNGYNPTEQLFTDLLPIWGNSNTEKLFTWKLVLKAGKFS